MNLDEATIMAYLLGELSPEEEPAVREAIAGNEEWQKIADDYRKLLTGFREERIQQYAAEVMDSDPPPPDPPRRSYWPWMLLILGVGLASLLFRSTATPPAELAQNYFRLPADPTVAGRNDATATYQNGLEAFFRDRDYPAAVNAFSVIEADTVWGLRAGYYLGHAHFLTGDYAAAERTLEQSLAQTDAFTRFELRDLRWNAMLARLAQDQDIRQELLAFPETVEGRAELLEALGE